MKKLLVSLFLINGFASHAQQNLVPNGDFEQYDICQTGLSQWYHARYWMNPMLPSSNPDYFNACSANPNWSVPTNAWGYEFARSGDGYVAIATAHVGSVDPLFNDNYREYLQAELTDTLTAGTDYCIKFYVSACDSFNYVSNDMGVYFSKTEINDTCFRCTLPYSPQFQNTSVLNSRNGWTEIYGIYKASGGEKFILIGNFKDSSATVTTYTGWVTAGTPFKNAAIYYIDDVSIIKRDTVTGTKENNGVSFFKVYPNPSNSIFCVESKNGIVKDIKVFDVIGNLIYNNISIGNKTIIKLTNYADGIYLLKISTENSFCQFKLIKN